MNRFQAKHILIRVGQLSMLCLVFTMMMPVQADSDAHEAQLLSLLDEFMEGASQSSSTMHDRFWAEDLIYTSSSGSRFGKAEIMEGLAAADPGDAAQSRYWAEDQQVKLLGDTAVVAFRLMAEDSNAATQQPPAVMQYFNTGTFVLRDGVWKAVAWQATRIPEATD